MKQPSKDTIDYYILPNKILCSTFGMWPSDKKRTVLKKILAYLHFIFSITTVLIIMVPEVVLMACKWNDLKVFAGAGCLTVSLTQLLFKTVYLTVRREKVYRLYTEMRSFWHSTNDPEERQSYELFVYWARTCTITFGMSCVGTVVVFTTTATYDYITDENAGAAGSNRHLLFDTWHEIDFIDSPEFEIIFVSQILASFVASCALSGLDATCVTIILHISGQFRLISTRLSNICTEMNCNQVDRQKYWSNLTADLISCIRHHQRLIKMVKDVNSLLTPIVFVQILTSSTVFCLGGYAIISNDTPNDALKFLSYIVSMSIQLLLWCWPGEILVQESLEIGYAVYVNVPWYKLPPFYRRQLCLIVLRSQKCCTMSAFFFQSLSICTLTNVLNTAFSYFALLRQVQDKTA